MNDNIDLILVKLLSITFIITVGIMVIALIFSEEYFMAIFGIIIIVSYICDTNYHSKFKKM